MLGRKRTIRSKQRDTCQTAYVKQYEASPDFTFPEEFDLSAHNILLSESIRTGNVTTVLLYWISKARSQAQEPAVAKILGLRNGQVVGEVIQVLAPRMPKWTENPAKWGNWIVGTAALFGALTVIRDNFTELFARPNVVIFAANSTVKNFHVGDTLDIPLVVRNQARLGQVEVSLKDVHLQPSDGSGSSNTLKFDISQVPQLQAGQNTDLHVIGMSPPLRSMKPQSYSIEVQAEAKEGLLMPARKPDYRPFTITIWPDQSTDIQAKKISPTVARIEMALTTGVGASSGLHGQLIFTSAIPPENGGIALMSGATSTGVPMVVTGSAGSVAKIQFQTGPIQPFHRYLYAVQIAFPHPLTAAEWNSLCSSMKVVFG
jgi:hypothetical protein